MKNCVGVADLLCAYADNELPESNKKIVEDHLLICANCSAILRVYNEISLAVDETNVPAPEALRVGVMNRIQSENIPREIDNNKQRKKYRYILSRFAPVAACLVFGLLVWQFWGTMWGSDNAASPAAPAPAAAPAAAPEVLLDSFEMPAAAGEEAQWDDAEAFGLDISMEEEAVPAPADRMTQMGEADWLQHLYDGIDGFGPLDGTDARLFREAHAVVTITGDLPVALAQFEPLPDWQYGRFGWEMLYSIPIPALADLLEEISGRDYVEVVFNNTDSAGNYVLILMTYGL